MQVWTYFGGPVMLGCFHEMVLAFLPQLCPKERQPEALLDKLGG